MEVCFYASGARNVKGLRSVVTWVMQESLQSQVAFTDNLAFHAKRFSEKRECYFNDCYRSLMPLALLKKFSIL